MPETSTKTAHPEDNVESHRCVAGPGCRDVKIIDGHRIATETVNPHSLCDACIGAVAWAIDDITEIWIALHMAVGDHTRRAGQKVSGSRAAPINVNTDVDALKIDIMEWMVAAAAPIAELLNIDDPSPRNHTDTEHARIVFACAAVIGPHLDKLIATPEVEVTVWLPNSETDYPGESIPCATSHTGYRPNTKVVHFTGAQIALKLRGLHRDARALLALTTPLDKLSLPCPGCNEYELSRRHQRWGAGEIDQIDCANCKLNWPYDRYRQLCLIWVKEDEMEREKLQQQLDEVTKERDVAAYLLAERNWQFELALTCTDIPASVFAQTVLTMTVHDPDTFMTDRDLAPIIGVAESTIRSWASQGVIGKHVADDGSMTFLASEVINHAKTQRRRPKVTAR